MIQTIDFNMFKEGFNKMNRQDQFSYKGLEALFNYLEELEEGTGEKIELDVIELCCAFSEYETIDDILNDYGYETIEEVYDRTVIIECNNSYIVQNF